MTRNQASMATGPLSTLSALRRVFAQPLRPRSIRTKPRAEAGKRWYAYSHSASPHSRAVSGERSDARSRR